MQIDGLADLEDVAHDVVRFREHDVVGDAWIIRAVPIAGKESMFCVFGGSELAHLLTEAQERICYNNNSKPKRTRNKSTCPYH